MLTFSIREANKNAKRRYQIHTCAKEEGFEFTVFSGLPAVIRQLNSSWAAKTAELVRSELKRLKLLTFYAVQVHAGREVFSLIISGYSNSWDVVNLLERGFELNAILRCLEGTVYRGHFAKATDPMSKILLKAVELAVSPSAAALLTKLPEGETLG
jgi:hypothetical protein